MQDETWHSRRRKPMGAISVFTTGNYHCQLPNIFHHILITKILPPVISKYLSISRRNSSRHSFEGLKKSAGLQKSPKKGWNFENMLKMTEFSNISPKTTWDKSLQSRCLLFWGYFKNRPFSLKMAKSGWNFGNFAKTDRIFLFLT